MRYFVILEGVILSIFFKACGSGFATVASYVLAPGHFFVLLYESDPSFKLFQVGSSPKRSNRSCKRWTGEACLKYETGVPCAVVSLALVKRANDCVS